MPFDCELDDAPAAENALSAESMQSMPRRIREVRHERRAELRLGMGRTKVLRVALRSKATTQGAVAQLVERFVRIEEVVVSITISSTRNPPEFHLRRVFHYRNVEFCRFLAFGDCVRKYIEARQINALGTRRGTQTGMMEA